MLRITAIALAAVQLGVCLAIIVFMPPLPPTVAHALNRMLIKRYAELYGPDPEPQMPYKHAVPASATVTDLPDGTVHIQAGASPAQHRHPANVVDEGCLACMVDDPAPERRVWQMPEGASLLFNIMQGDAMSTYEPIVGLWYVGVNASQTLKLYGATARYEGEGRWYLGTGNRIDLFQYDYLQELV